MVTAKLLDVIFGAAEWLLGFLPDSSLSLPSLSGVVDRLGDLNYFLPLGEVFSVVTGVLSLGPAFIMASLSLWLGVGIVRGGATHA